MRKTLFVFLLLISIITNAQTYPPEIPNQFYGFVSIANQSAPDNTIITAQIGRVNHTILTKYSGTFGCCNSNCSAGICPSDVFYVSRNDTNTTVLFYVSGVNIVNTSFESGGYTFLNLSYPLDIFPPSIYNLSPTGTITTNATTLSAKTNEIARCRVGTTPGVPYDNMPAGSTTSWSTSHSWSVSGLTSGNYTYYVRCIDQSGNKNPTDAIINFLVSIPTPPTGENVTPGAPPGEPTPKPPPRIEACKEEWIIVVDQSLYFQRCLSVEGNTSTFTLSLEHVGDRVMYNLEFKEKLPLEVATSPKQLTINLTPEGFEEGEMLIIIWIFEKFSPKEKIEWKYSINKPFGTDILDKFTTPEIREIGIPPKPECTTNEDCPEDKYCKNGKCLPVRGICGYVHNHTWIRYECCEDADCGEGKVCRNHTCVLKEILPPVVVCGNGKCESGETCETCPEDCGECPPLKPFDLRLIIIVFIGALLILLVIGGGILYLYTKEKGLEK